MSTGRCPFKLRLTGLHYVWPTFSAVRCQLRTTESDFTLTSWERLLVHVRVELMPASYKQMLVPYVPMSDAFFLVTPAHIKI